MCFVLQLNLLHPAMPQQSEEFAELVGVRGIVPCVCGP